MSQQRSSAGRWRSWFDRVDRFLASEWWWRWQLHRAELALEKALLRTGEDSFATRKASAKLQRAQFAIDFGRPLHLQVQEAVRLAEKSGVPRHALRLIVINLDIRADKNGRIFVRRNWWLTAMSWSMRILVVAGMAYMAGLIIGHPANRPLLKLVLLCGFGSFFFCMAYAWDFFGMRAVRAAHAYAEHIEALNETLALENAARVVPLRAE